MASRVAMALLRNSRHRCEGEREEVNKDVVIGQAETAGAIEKAFSDGDFVFDGFGHAGFVNSEGDNPGSVALAEGEDALGAFFAVFEVDAVDERLSGEALKGFFDDRYFGGVDHDGHGDVLVVEAEEDAHVAGFVAAT